MNENGFAIPKKLILFLGILYIATFLFFAFVEKSWIDPAFGFPVHNGGDSGGYFLLAKNLLRFGTFSYSLHPPFVLEALRSPGYPLFVACILFIFRLPLFVSIIQLALSFVTGLLIYDILRSLAEKKWAIIGACLFWCNPTVLFYSITILSDTLFVFLEVLAFWIIWKRRDVGSHFIASLLIGYAALVRPAGSYLAIIFLVWLFFSVLREHSRKIALYRILIFLLGTLLVVTPWMYRNYRAYGNFEISSVGPYTLLFYDMEALRVNEGQTQDAVEKGWLNEIGAASRSDASSPRFSKQEMEIFKQELFATPASFGIFEIKGIVQFFLGSGIADVRLNTATFNAYLGTHHLSRFFVLIEWAERIFMLFLAMLFCIAPILVRKDVVLRLIIFASVAIAVYTALVIGPIPNARYRLAALPFIIIPAAYSFVRLLERQNFYKKNNSILQ